MIKTIATNKAFTLIELLVVVLIIGILAAIALPQYQKAVAKSRLTQLITMTKALNDAQARVFLATGGNYARDIKQLDIDVAQGFDLCYTHASGQYYTNGIHHLILRNDGWGMGNLTSIASCLPITAKAQGVYTYIPGMETCDATEKQPCTYCIQFPAAPEGLCVAAGAQEAFKTNSAGLKMHRLN